MEAAARSDAQARERLARLEHIVVLQLENRSFDHMLGYLDHPEHRGDFEETVDGLAGARPNSYEGVSYAPEPLDQSVFDSHKLDPPHEAEEVETQIAGGSMTGFVDAWAHKLHEKNGRLRWFKRRWAKLRGRPYLPPEKLRAVMGYVTPDMVPVYDRLAREFCVCDHWFCGVPGPTMPNRYFSVAGTTDGEMSNVRLLLKRRGDFRSLFQWLESQDMWRWYSSDPGILRAIDDEYMFDVEEYDHFAYFDEFTREQKRTFLSDITDGTLPAVAWIDPNFALGNYSNVLERLKADVLGSNDDHPPARLIEAQHLVNKVYEALGRSADHKYWNNTLLVVYYDEHGGFYDHVAPPQDRGPRIPALLVGGPVKKGVCSVELDHASLIKTILLRFGDQQKLAEDPMPARVMEAADLSVALRDDREVTPFRSVENPGKAEISDDDLRPKDIGKKASRATRAVEFLERKHTELQELIARYHAIPLRTGRPAVARVPTKRLRRLAVRTARKPEAERLPDRRP